MAINTGHTVELLPSLEDGRRGSGARHPSSSELPHRTLRALIAPPSVPSLLSRRTSALVVGGDAAFVRSTSALLSGMGVRVRAHGSVAGALSALEEDIVANGCITYDQIIAEVGRGDDEGAEALLAELQATSWPASVVFVTPSRPAPAQLARLTACGARAVLVKDASSRALNAVELRNAFTHLKRRPHEDLWQERSAKGLAATVHSYAPSTRASEPPSTPLHITAMGVGMATYLHIHAGRQRGPSPAQAFDGAGAFESDTPPGAEEVDPEWIYRFALIVAVNLQLEEPILVTAVVLLERACRLAQLVLTESNWQSVLLAAIIVAAKCHYDQSVWLSDFVCRLRMYPLELHRLHGIEMAFLRALRYRVTVRPSSFYRYSTEIATLHDQYCPYKRSMTCDLGHRMLAKESSAWPKRCAAPPAVALCVPCAPGLVK